MRTKGFYRYCVKVAVLCPGLQRPRSHLSGAGLEYTRSSLVTAGTCWGEGSGYPRPNICRVSQDWQSDGQSLECLAVSTSFERSYQPVSNSLFRDVDGNQLVARTTGDSVLVSLSSSVNAGFSNDENALVELRFDTQTLKAGSEFRVLVRSSKGPSVFQRVESEGRAAMELVDSGTARPQLLPAASIVDKITIPATVSPNGDGVNDQLEIEFTVLTIRGDRPVEVAIYDLSGRRVASASPGSGLDRTQSGVVRFSGDRSATTGGPGAARDLHRPNQARCRRGAAPGSTDRPRRLLKEGTRRRDGES